MKFFCGVTISRMSFFLGMVTPKINNFFLVRYLSLPAFILFFHPRKSAHTFQAMFIGCFGICSILSICGFSQIFNSVICFVAIYMVNLVFRPFFVNKEPNKSMGGVMLPINFKVYISPIMRMPSNAANLYFGARSFPNQVSRGWIIV